MTDEDTMKPEVGDLVQLPIIPDGSPIAILFPRKISDFGVIIEVKPTKLFASNNTKKSGWVCQVMSSGNIFQHWFEDLTLISKMDIG